MRSLLIGTLVVIASLSLPGGLALGQGNGKGGSGGGSGGGGSTAPVDPAIAYVNSGLWVMDEDGSNAVRLISLKRGESIRGPSWSPDNSKLVFAGTLGGQRGIYTVNIDGTGRTLIAPLNNSVAFPDWSVSPGPDGQHKIVYTDYPPGNSGYKDVYIMNTDGSGRMNLTNTPETFEHDAAWSPDGQRLVVTRDSEHVVLFELGLDDGQIVVQSATVIHSGFAPAFPRWSNTQEQITFTSWDYWPYLRIVTQDLAPLAAPILLTSASADERWSSFSPDDSRLAFHRGGSGGGIFTIGGDGTGEMRIATSGSDPSWRKPGGESAGSAGGTCYANCDGSTAAPVLNVDDFICFINSFAAAQQLPHYQQVNHYANCDQSTAAPVLNVDDFICFINAFAQGCP